MGVINPMLLSACDLGKVQNFKLLKKKQQRTVLIYVFMLDLFSFSFLLYYFFPLKERFCSFQYLFGAMLNVQYASAEGIIRSNGKEEQIDFRLLSL